MLNAQLLAVTDLATLLVTIHPIVVYPVALGRISQEKINSTMVRPKNLLNVLCQVVMALDTHQES